MSTLLESNAMEFLWLEITGTCPLECNHCYADSSPRGTTGEMSEADWLRVIEQAAALGIKLVQFIGGEPLMHPSLPHFVEHALALGLKVEVYTNLVVLTESHLKLLRRPGVRVATSYYSGKPEEHEAITGRARSHKLTTRNIGRVVQAGIPLRVGMIKIEDNQDTEGALRILQELGVNKRFIGTDRLRQVGRGIRDVPASMDQLCGHCGVSNGAILPNGDFHPCVFSRWNGMAAGNVLESSLAEIVSGETLSELKEELFKHFTAKHMLNGDPCRPDCSPNTCGPHILPNPCSPTCSPRLCEPTSDPNCLPNCQPTSRMYETDDVCAPEAACSPTDIREEAMTSIDGCGCGPNGLGCTPEG